jgi:ATP-dependent DNA helicase RecQ
MIRFSSNYCNCEPNFVIQNLPDPGFSEQLEFKQRAAVVVMQNILQRGKPFTRPSEYLSQNLGKVGNTEDFLPLIAPITKYFPVWLETIKGDDLNDYYPAKEFIETLWGEYLPQYLPLVSLIEPEVLISNIVEKTNPKFKDQAVDFYQPHARLVIEIDGSSHGDPLASANAAHAQKLLDDERDRYLTKHHIKTIRISTFAILRRNDELRNRFNEILSQIEHVAATDEGQIHKYLHLANNPQDYSSEENLRIIQLTTVFRAQMLILKAIKIGILKFSNPTWQIAILDPSKTQQQLWELAVHDLNLWFATLFKILKVSFEPIEVKVELCSNLDDLSQATGDLRVDLNVFRRWTDENNYWGNIVMVRTDYDLLRDHFRVETLPQLIDYSIVDDGEDSDRPAFDFLLRNLFGFNDDFRVGQYPIIKNLMMRRNTIGILPTGGGKTLCYLFAALLQPGISFVVSPLRSLMHDQKRNVQKLGISRVEYMNSLQSAVEKDQVLQSFAQSRYFLIWISPERFQQEKFREHINQLIGQKTVAYAVIDEVHCLSEWGHSFRVSYLTLVSAIRRYLPNVVLAGLTATASDNVLRDIKVEFDPLKTDVVVPPKFSREKLKFQIDTPADIQGKYNLLLSTLKFLDNKYHIMTPNGGDTRSSIIFAINKGSEKRNLWSVCTLVRELKRDLQTEKIGIFHGSLDEGVAGSNNERESIRQQEDFIENRHPIIVATKAFGMGINKENIRYVFLYGVPVSLEELYQQAGRAGRDDNVADCLILYTKDHLPDNLRNELFTVNCSIERMHAIVQKLDDCDLKKQLYLWLKNNRGIAKEVQLASYLYNFSIKVNQIVSLPGGSIMIPKMKTQKFEK